MSDYKHCDIVSNVFVSEMGKIHHFSEIEKKSWILQRKLFAYNLNSDVIIFVLPVIDLYYRILISSQNSSLGFSTSSTPVNVNFGMTLGWPKMTLGWSKMTLGWVCVIRWLHQMAVWAILVATLAKKSNFLSRHWNCTPRGGISQKS